MHSESASNVFMQYAIDLSLRNVRGGIDGPFGAVIVRDDEIVAEGTNLVASSLDCTAHAEVVAIRGACAALHTFSLDGCEIYTTTEPCPMCLGAIYWSRLKKIFYANAKEDAASIGFDDSIIYTEFARPIPERRIPMARMMAEEAMAAFREWKSNPNRVKY